MNKVLTAIVELMTALKNDSQSPLYMDTGTPTNTPHGIRRVFFGDPQQIETDSFPAVVVRPVGSRVVQSGTKTDVKEHDVEIVIVDNLRNYVADSIDVAIDPAKVQYLVTVMSMMESMDANQQTSGKSVVGKMLANQRLPYTDNGTKYAAVMVQLQSVDYVFNTSRGFPSFEVIALFRVTSRGDRA